MIPLLALYLLPVCLLCVVALVLASSRTNVTASSRFQHATVIAVKTAPTLRPPRYARYFAPHPSLFDCCMWSYLSLEKQRAARRWFSLHSIHLSFGEDSPRGAHYPVDAFDIYPADDVKLIEINCSVKPCAARCPKGLLASADSLTGARTRGGAGGA